MSTQRPQGKQDPGKLCAEQVRDALRELLEQKHLYQKVSVKTLLDPVQLVLGSGFDFSAILWSPVLHSNYGYNSQSNVLSFQVVNAQLQCRKCDRIQAFAPIDVANFRAEVVTPTSWLLRFQCQGCSMEPEVLMVTRQGVTLTLTGRSPIEEVCVPKIIPRNQKEHIGNAILARQCGQLLAALFHLRVFVEQYCEECASNLPPSGPGRKAADSIDAYMKNLDQDFKARAPSLQKLYEELSARIHTADASKDSALYFDRAIEDVVGHLEGKSFIEKYPAN